MHSTVEIDDDSRELLNGMLAYRARNRLTLEECLQHKWIDGQKVHTPSELQSVLWEKHKESRNKRRLDKRKMRQLENSPMKRTMDIYHCPKNIREEASSSSIYSVHNRIKDISSFVAKLPSVKTFIPSLLTFFAPKGQLTKAYDAAFNVFNIAFKGKSRTIFNPQNPWEVETTVKVSDGVSEQEFLVALHICEIEGTERVAFKFRRCLGDSITFARIWTEVEQCLINLAGNIFFDALDEKSIPEDESKKDY